MNKFIRKICEESCRRKMNKLEQKLSIYASFYFRQELTVMYVPVENLKVKNGVAKMGGD